MKIAAALTLSAALAASASPVWAQQRCPTGSYPSFDSWGNHVCKRFDDGSTATAEVRGAQKCPNGAYPTVDNFGNKVCRSFDAPGQPRTDYYDTSKGCPMGTYPSVDSYGNKACKKY